jgi:hypothetical protein
LVGKPEEKRPLGGPRHRCDDDIRIGLREIGWEISEWILEVRANGGPL